MLEFPIPTFIDANHLIMKNIQAFLLFSSGVEQSILNRCPTDRNRYMAIGATVFFTGLLAFVSASYALYTVFQSVFMAVVLGLVWGTMIYNLDRFIVLSLRSTGKFQKDVLVALPRMVLALLFAVVISTPLELRIFQNEIEGELVLMNQEQQKAQETLVRSRFADERNELLATRSGIESELTALRTRRDELEQMALQEADGTGGSMKRNLGPIYAAKKEAADKVNAELVERTAASQGILTTVEENLAKNIQDEQAALEAMVLVRQNGLIARLEALSRLTAQSSMIFTAHLFIFLLFVALELAPVFVKLLSLGTPYDRILDGHEHAFHTIHKVKTHRADEEMHEKMEVATAVIRHRAKATIETEKAIIDRKLKEKLGNVANGNPGWDGKLST